MEGRGTDVVMTNEFDLRSKFIPLVFFFNNPFFLSVFGHRSINQKKDKKRWFYFSFVLFSSNAVDYRQLDSTQVSKDKILRQNNENTDFSKRFVVVPIRVKTRPIKIFFGRSCCRTQKKQSFCIRHLCTYVIKIIEMIEMSTYR